jgi:PilZ domain-containing protein
MQFRNETQVMLQDNTLIDRKEKRFPIIVVASLGDLRRTTTDGAEWTYTDNISAHGARVFSKHVWQPGDEITLTPFKEETVSGNVVYCQRITGDRYWIGVRLKDYQNAWGAIRRYDGIQMSALVESL